MKIHEYQAKALFKTYSIPVPRGQRVKTVEEAANAVTEIGPFPLIVKAQIHAGGRGKGGGIRIAGDIGALKDAVRDLLGKRLITPQTDEEGLPVNDILAEEALKIGREIYLGITIDRNGACVSVLASAEGGMEIEQLASTFPGSVITESIDPGIGLRPFQASRIAYALGLDHPASKKMGATILNLYRLFIEKDCSLAEINPLVLTKSGELVALDGKIAFDDNALWRHPDVSVMRDTDQENPLDVEASKYNLNYIKLKGHVGCMVNGAGLAMATMDLIKHFGEAPANFLDVGGGATAKMISEGLKILLSDKDVRVILINIFGGILRCDILARGVVDAARELKPVVPVVIRLEGTNVDAGRAILEASDLSFIVASDMGDAAIKVAEALRIRDA